MIEISSRGYLPIRQFVECLSSFFKPATGIFRPRDSIKKDSYLFLLLTRMQDEVHRYTITYHKDIRSKGALSSILDNIDGIGEVRKQKILKKYKTIDKMRTAPLDELKELMPENIALNFHNYLENMQ